MCWLWFVSSYGAVGVLQHRARPRPQRNPQVGVLAPATSPLLLTLTCTQSSSAFGWSRQKPPHANRLANVTQFAPDWGKEAIVEINHLLDLGDHLHHIPALSGLPPAHQRQIGGTLKGQQAVNDDQFFDVAYLPNL